MATKGNTGRAEVRLLLIPRVALPRQLGLAHLNFIAARGDRGVLPRPHEGELRTRWCELALAYTASGRCTDQPVREVQLLTASQVELYTWVQRVSHNLHDHQCPTIRPSLILPPGSLAD